MDSSPLMVSGEKVYTLSSNILDLHPGGKDAILLYLGTSGTQAFVSVGHTEDGNAKGLLQACEDGEPDIPSPLISFSQSHNNSFEVVSMGLDCA